MYFYVSKLLWLILPPLNLVVLLMLAGAALGGRKTGMGRALTVAGWALLVVCGVLPTGKIMLRYLEAQYPMPRELPADVTGILVMGGAFDVGTSLARHNPTLYGSAERVTEATRLMKLYPGATVVYSGGNATLYQQNPSEADVFKAYLAGQHIDDAHVLYEKQSRNTSENITYSLLAGKPQAKDTWIVVTSAAHMPRTMNVMEQQAWPGTIIPDPVDFQSAGDNTDFVPDPNLLGNFTACHLAMREWLAVAVYRFTGRTGALVQGRQGI